MTPSLALVLLLAAPADGGGKYNFSQCMVSVESNDRFQKGGDVVVGPGETVHDAIAIDGNVLIKKGAKVHDVTALNGSVTVEEGAIVKGSVVAVSGKLSVSPKAKVSGSQVAVDDQSLHVVSEDGDRTNISISVGGHNLVGAFLKPVLGKLRDCDVQIGE